ncbi:S41 family peptidase [uncultured Aquimarina sp.]|uniref:S41 family peptidase n=1 Tax=uncultured Aquimarina sp. TaxID=575652 RepID=UPI0026182839|nr:S41 family peptidase [uncultured Aquimarina sp.]
MKRLLLVVIIGVSVVFPKVYSQGKVTSVQDSINMFYDRFFEELEANYLYRKSVNWSQIKPYIKKEALKGGTFEKSLEISSKLFDTIQGDHLLLFSEKGMYQSNLKRKIEQEDLHRNLLIAYSEELKFEAKVINDHYGYVFIPGMLLLNATEKELNERAQKIYDAILKLNKTQKIKGWIIDLRLNIGGNSNVMLAGLYHLIGDNTVSLYLDADKNVKNRSGLHNGIYYEDQKIQARVKTIAKPNTEIPVALITGVMTASAGEFVALGFRGRKNTVIIGEESYGLTTANDLFELPFKTKAAITLSYATDRSAVFTKSIKPQIEIVKEADFKDLTKDKNVIEAIKFIDSK